MTEKIAKVIAHAGICSRRDAERYVQEGRVKVNGAYITSPALRVSVNDKIMVDEREILRGVDVKMWLFYKPSGVITTHRDPKGRIRVFDLLPKNLERVISVGRLDYNTEGLLLLTNYGPLARYMELPASGIRRLYRCRVHGKLTDAITEKIRRGLVIEGIKYAGMKVKVQRQEAANSWVELELSEGKNREIRRIFEHFGMQVNRLIRLRYGEFQLGNMKVGELVEVPQKAVNELQAKIEKPKSVMQETQ
jgi:23S rRNA pseudouridine2605 synthase